MIPPRTLKPRFSTSRALRFLPIAMSCVALTSHAANDFWDVAGPAAWTDGANWSLGTAPTNADLAIIKNGGEATVGAGDTITISNLRFINGTLTMTGGSIANSTSEMRIGDYAFDGTTGTANLTMSGSSTITASGRLYIADGNGQGSTVSTANVTLSGNATLTNNNDYIVIGRQGGKAVVELTDNAKIEKQGTTNRLILGDGNSGEAHVTLNENSQLKTANAELWVGNGGGANAYLLVKDNAIVTKGGTGGFLTIARDNSTATLEVEGSGKVISQNHVRLGEGANANATLIMRENATMEIATRLETHNGGSNATVTMSDNAAMTISGGDTAAIGAGNTAVVSFTLSDSASITASNSKWKVGDYGDAVDATGTTAITLNNNSGIELRELTVGHIGGPTATATVTVNNNAVLKVNNFVTLGRDDNTTNNGMNGRVILNGGTLATSSVRQGGIAAGAEPNASRNSISVNGGTIQALADEADFFQATANNTNRPYVYIDAGGLTFDTQEFNVGIQTVLHGTGDFTKIGGGILTLSGTQDYTGNTFVVEGTLSINTAYLADTAAVYLYTGATFDLDFLGTDTINALYIDDVIQPIGVYNSSNLAGFITGTGSLTVVPEPSAYAVGVAGVLALSAIMRRRKARKA